MTKGAGLRPEAKAAEPPPDPTVGAPVLDSTVIRNIFGKRTTAVVEWIEVTQVVVSAMPFAKSVAGTVVRAGQGHEHALLE